MSHTFIVIYTTFPNKKVARTTIDKLIARKLVACGNIFKLDSIYEWKGKTEHTKEWGVFIKTRKANYKNVESFILRHHPYEVPEVICWDIKKGLPKYLDWICENTT